MDLHEEKAGPPLLPRSALFQEVLSVIGKDEQGDLILVQVRRVVTRQPVWDQGGE
jgi:hypothetical protein